MERERKKLAELRRRHYHGEAEQWSNPIWNKSSKQIQSSKIAQTPSVHVMHQSFCPVPLHKKTKFVAHFVHLPSVQNSLPLTYDDIWKFSWSGFSRFIAQIVVSNINISVIKYYANKSSDWIFMVTILIWAKSWDRSWNWMNFI